MTPGHRPQAPGGSPNRRGLVPRHYRLETPCCAALTGRVLGGLFDDFIGAKDNSLGYRQPE
jgi:hypothetical protein